MGSILTDGKITAIVNGGNPLPGCPESWESAHEWEAKVNAKKEEFSEPRWKFDCGFKLDFDGPILTIESRFYPPATHYGPKWDGTMTIRILETIWIEKEFQCDSLEQLREEVEKYQEHITGIIKARLNP